MSTQTPETGTATAGSSAPAHTPPRIVIQLPSPAVDDGRYPAKRCVGDRVAVQADVFRDGHDLIRATVRYLGPGDEEWREAELRPLDAEIGGVRWSGEFEVDRTGRWLYTIESWTDLFGTWRDELARKVRARQHDQPDDSSGARSGEAGRRAGGRLEGELSEGVVLLRQAARQADSAADRRLIEHAAGELTDPAVPDSAKHDVALGEELFATVERYQPRHGRVSLAAADGDRG